VSKKTKLEKIHTKADLIRLFCQYSVKAIPILETGGRLCGILRKKDLIASTSESPRLTSLAKDTIKRYIKPIDAKDELQKILHLFFDKKSASRLPVLNKEGSLVNLWSKGDFVQALEGSTSFSQETWEVFFNSLPDPILIVGEDGRITYLNSAASNLWGRGLSMIGKRLKSVIPEVKFVKDKPVYEEFIKFGQEDVVYDGIPAYQNGLFVGSLYILRRLREINQEEIVISYKEWMLDAEKDILKRAFQKAKGDLSLAAKYLDLPKRTLQTKLKRLNLLSDG
jgi:PAS domain S-box-containing protein